LLPSPLLCSGSSPIFSLISTCKSQAREWHCVQRRILRHERNRQTKANTQKRTNSVQSLESTRTQRARAISRRRARQVSGSRASTPRRRRGSMGKCAHQGDNQCTRRSKTGQDHTVLERCRPSGRCEHTPNVTLLGTHTTRRRRQQDRPRAQISDQLLQHLWHGDVRLLTEPLLLFVGAEATSPPHKRDAQV
jgi:hypothetical protein